jgi:hypothetical protein
MIRIFFIRLLYGVPSGFDTRLRVRGYPRGKPETGCRSPTVIAANLGHTNMRMTERRYAHRHRVTMRRRGVSPPAQRSANNVQLDRLTPFSSAAPSLTRLS